MRKSERNTRKKNNELTGLAVRLGVTVIIVILLFTFLIGVHINHGNNMAPAMRDGGLVITNKVERLLADQVVYYKTTSGGTFGRIVGMPGDVIYLDNTGKFTINGNIPQELIYYKTYEGEGIKYPYTVPEESYFILNDMREDITDSRMLGAIPKENVEGAVYLEIRRRGF